MKRVFWLVFLFCLFFFSSFDAHRVLAQKADSTKIAVLPGLYFSSDSGLGATALFQYVNYYSDKIPFRHRFLFNGSFTTTGNAAFEVKYENRSTNGNQVRVNVFSEWISNAYYFGFGSDSEFDQSLWEEEFYHYSRRLYRVRLEHGISLKPNSKQQEQFIGFYGLEIASMKTNIDDDSQLGLNPPNFRVNGSSIAVIAGLRVEKRDSPFRPSDGYFLNINLSLAPKVFGNEFNHIVTEAYLSRYVSFDFFQEFVFASRLGFKQAIGKVPFIALPYAGGQYDLRGYPLERFRDKGVAIYNLELRTWLFSLPFWNIEAGGQLFIDGGLVYDHPFNANYLDEHLLSYGLGGVVSAFNPDFIIRCDLGFSSEIWRISLGVGYLF